MIDVGKMRKRTESEDMNWTPYAFWRVEGPTVMYKQAAVRMNVFDTAS